MCNLSVPGHDLLMLAVEAAVDISNLISGRRNDLAAMQNLAKELDEYIGKSLRYKGALSLNTAIIHIFNESLKRTGKILTSVSELPDEIVGVVKILNNPKAAKAEDLKKAQDFCLALSVSIMAYKKENFSYRFQF